MYIWDRFIVITPWSLHIIDGIAHSLVKTGDSPRIAKMLLFIEFTSLYIQYLLVEAVVARNNYHTPTIFLRWVVFRPFVKAPDNSCSRIVALNVASTAIVAACMKDDRVFGWSIYCRVTLGWPLVIICKVDAWTPRIVRVMHDGFSYSGGVARLD